MGALGSTSPVLFIIYVKLIITYCSDFFFLPILIMFLPWAYI